MRDAATRHDVVVHAVGAHAEQQFSAVLHKAGIFHKAEVKDGKAGAFRCLNALKISRISNNLGDAKSLVTHPATTTHQRLAPEARAELGISEGFIRFSAGLEHPDDLIEDFQRALEQV